MTATQDTPVSAPTTIDAGPLTLSARIRRPHQQPRGVIVALHGGTYDSSYYDTGADGLLDLAATLGYLVVAVDRPGYGATHGADPELLTFDAQTTILSQALLRIWTDIAQRAGLLIRSNRRPVQSRPHRGPFPANLGCPHEAERHSSANASCLST